MRRVVVTGLGMVTPLGCGVDTTWTRILNGQSGARKIDTFEVADLASQIACVIGARSLSTSYWRFCPEAAAVACEAEKRHSV